MPSVKKSPWVTHSENETPHAIYAIDIQPDGERFATGGASSNRCGVVKIWNLRALDTPSGVVAAQSSDAPQLLCRLESHTSNVNCVRWSNRGTFLASASDDTLVLIWQFVGRTAHASSSFGGRQGNVEHWRCMHTLRGHSMDVLHLAWHPGDLYLASASVDNSIVIWNALRFPEMFRTLKGHEGLVKGVTWDPIGTFLASQSDDKTLRIWSTSSWSLIKTISKPFEECASSTLMLRLDWTPDGKYVISAHSLNNGGPVAKLIERSSWSHELDLAGHRKAVTCVRCNRMLFTRSSDPKKAAYDVIALGSKDKSVSIWTSCDRRPLMVMTDLFRNSVTDMTWSSDGYALLIASMDGTVALFKFTPDELGSVVPIAEKNSGLAKIYGKVPVPGGFANSNGIVAAEMNGCASDAADEVIETPDILKARRLLAGFQKKISVGSNSTAEPLAKVNHSLVAQDAALHVNGSASLTFDLGRNGVEATDAHQTTNERRMNGCAAAATSSAQANGPIACSVHDSPCASAKKCADSEDMQVSPPQQRLISGLANSVIQSSSNSSMEKPTARAKQVETKLPDGRRRIAPIFLGSAYADTSNNSASALDSSPVANFCQDSNSCSIILNQSTQNNSSISFQSSSSNQKSTIEVVVQQDDRGGQNSSGIPSISRNAVAAVDNGSFSTASGALFEGSSSAPIVGLAKPKRKDPPSVDDCSTSSQQNQAKRVKPAATATSGAADAALGGSQRYEQSTSTKTLSSLPSRPAATALSASVKFSQAPPQEYAAASSRPLQVPSRSKKISIEIQTDAGTLLIEAQNDVSLGNGLRVPRLACSCAAVSRWHSVLSSPVLILAGSSSFVAAASLDQSVSVLSLASGAILLSGLMLEAAPAALALTGCYLMALTCNWKVTVWDVQARSVVLCNISCEHLNQDADSNLNLCKITDNGAPIIGFTSGRIFSFSQELSSWISVANAQDPRFLSTGILQSQQMQINHKLLGPLAMLTEHAKMKAPVLSRHSAAATGGGDLLKLCASAFYEQQLQSCLALKSGGEYRYWLQQYVAHLVKYGNELRLRELFGDFLRGELKSETILNLSKQTLLKELLPLLSVNSKLQRLYTEFNYELLQSSGSSRSNMQSTTALL